MDAQHTKTFTVLEDCGQRLEVSSDESLWLRPHQSMLYLADPSSREYRTPSNNPQGVGRWCVACSILTWEEERKQEDSETKQYGLSLHEQNRGTAHLHCKRCGHHLCNLCAQLFYEKLLSLQNKGVKIPPWCKMVQDFLQAAQLHRPGFVMDAMYCFSCEHKASCQSTVSSSCRGTTLLTNRNVTLPWKKYQQPTTKKPPRKSQKIVRHKKDKYKVLKKKKKEHKCYLDGLLYFPTLSIVIRSTTKYFDTLSMAKQIGCGNASPEPALPHMNITPLNAYYLEEHGFSPKGNCTDIEMLREDFIVPYQHPADQSLTLYRKVEVIVIKSPLCNGKNITQKDMGTDWVDENSIESCVEYLSTEHMKKSSERGIDVIAIFAAPTKDGGQMHAVTLRWLAKALPPQSERDSEELFKFFHGRLAEGKGKMEISRVGGSNGLAHVSTEFFNMLHNPGITPRKSHAVMWIPCGTKWIYLYISPYKSTRKLCCRAYCQPMPGGQTRITKDALMSSKCPPYFRAVFKDFLIVKAESAPLVCALNRLFLLPKLGIAACRESNIVQNATNTIARICSKLNKDPEEFYLHLLTTCSFTVICYATRLHVDTPKNHELFKIKTFWENKWIVEVPSLGTQDSDNLALGRGGAGRGKFVFAILDHSYDICRAYGWGNQSEEGNGELFRELIEVAREFDLGGPDPPEDVAVLPEMIEDAIDHQQDHHLLFPGCITS